MKLQEIMTLIKQLEEAVEHAKGTDLVILLAIISKTQADTLAKVIMQGDKLKNDQEFKDAISKYHDLQKDITFDKLKDYVA